MATPITVDKAPKPKDQQRVTAEKETRDLFGIRAIILANMRLIHNAKLPSDPYTNAPSQYELVSILYPPKGQSIVQNFDSAINYVNLQRENKQVYCTVGEPGASRSRALSSTNSPFNPGVAPEFEIRVIFGPHKIILARSVRSFSFKHAMEELLRQASSKLHAAYASGLLKEEVANDAPESECSGSDCSGSCSADSATSGVLGVFYNPSMDR